MFDKITLTLIRLGVDQPRADDFKGLPIVKTDNISAPQTVLSIVFGVIAALAILVIVLAGLRMVTGGNDPDKIARAKRTIIFAFVGLAVALAAQAIVAVVLEGVF